MGRLLQASVNPSWHVNRNCSADTDWVDLENRSVMKNLSEVLLAEPDLVLFLNRKEYFGEKYNGLLEEYLVITDPIQADYYFHLDADYGNWNSIQNSDWGEIEELTSPEFMSESLTFVAENILDESKSFHGAEVVLENLQDNIISDICGFLEFGNMEISIPPIWQSMKYVYLHNGWPCGWDGDYPRGRMVVFSNDRNL